jgi:riboflavin synthase
VFTGLIESVEPVQSNTSSPAGRRLCVPLGKIAEGVKPGDSICVNGVCLTVSELKGSVATFDVMAETARVSTIGQWKAGELVNLERAMAADGRFGGHIVQGHIDSVGTVKRVEKGKAQYVLSIAADSAFLENVINQGSVAVDGVSLTIVHVAKDQFTVSLIPTTLAETNIREKRVGDKMNLEADIVSKWIIKRVNQILSDQEVSGNLTIEKLRAKGFA